MSTPPISRAIIVNGHIQVENEKSAAWIAEQIARANKLAGKSGEVVVPTEAQSEIIESKHWGPAIVVAGAGSGKTETMSQRVLWLVVNGVVRPDEILGLTFTRKAAGELSTRIRKRLRQLQSVGALPKDSLTGESLDLTVGVSTYHSYAGKVLSEYGIRIGVDAQAAPLGEAAAWLLFNNVVMNSDRKEYEIQKSASWAVGKVISLSSQIGEHAVDVAELEKITREQLQEFDAITGKLNDKVRDAIEALQNRLELLHMVDEAKRIRWSEGKFTYDDQMSIAADLVNQIPDIASQESSRYKVVLLDEYQDTSQSQIRFLSALFGSGYPVTAVGDPNQAIYGWRGASAGTMSQFARDFKSSPENPVEHYELLTSWRNDERILDFANLLVADAANRFARTSSVKQLIAKPRVGQGELLCGRYLTKSEEAEAIADYIEERWVAHAINPETPSTASSTLSSTHDSATTSATTTATDSASGSRRGKKGPTSATFAVLVRAKAYIPEIEQALRERGIPTEVLGLSGLIHVPEVADIIALLRSAIDPDAGTSLARLLTGPRLALGAADIRALGKYSRKIADSSKMGRSKTLEKLLTNGGGNTAIEGDDFAIGSIIEALELIDDAPPGLFSHDGVLRLKEFSAELKDFRRELTGSIVDSVIEAERFLRLDTEVLVRDGWQSGRKHLDAFLDEASNFQRTGGSLSTFLQWLEVADKREGGLKPVSVTENRDAVQLLSIHGSKGAEWDYVVIPGLIERNFPSNSKESPGHMSNAGAIPITLRGDRAEFRFDFQMPNLEVKSPAARVKDALDAFGTEWRNLELQEEYRVGYVAFTRARHGVFATSTHYKDGKGAVNASAFYTLLREHLAKSNPDGVLHELADFTGLDENGEKIENPKLENPRTASWPQKSETAESIQRTAEIVNAAGSLPADYQPQNEEEASLLADATMLLNEINSRRSESSVFLPSRLSVSTMIALKKNPESLALNLRRPMPNFSNPFARRGTQFHEWIERYFEKSTLFDDDALDPHSLPSKDEKALEELKQLWLDSEWASRSPYEVEGGFETVLEGVVVKGRIDAVYRQRGEDGEYRYEVVDWKTGRELEGEDLASASIQLAMYRLAYSKLHQIPLDRISAAFFYIPNQKTLRPVDLMGEEELLEIIRSVPLA